MSLVTRSALASIDVSTAQFAPQITGLLAGEDLDVAAPCYIKSSDGYVYMSNGTSANEAAEVVGFAARHTHSGEPCTLFGKGARFRYGTGLTPGDVYYVGGTKGRLDTGATTGDAFGVAQAISATDIRVIRDIPPFTSATLGDATVTLAKLDALPTGSLIVGVGDRPTEVTSWKTDTYIPVGNGTTVVPRAVSGDATLANTGALTLAAGKLTGSHVKETAAAEVLGAIPVLYRTTVAAGANGNTDITITNKTMVIDAWIVLKGAGVGSATLQVKNGTNPITDAMAASGSDGAIVRAASLVTAQCSIADGGTLRVTGAGGASMPDAEVYVLGLRLA